MESEIDFVPTIISLGAGLQSTTLCYLSENGVLPRADAIVFADTHDEPQWVYDTIERIKQDISIPLHVISKGSLSASILNDKRFSSAPFYIRTENGDAIPTRRQCTEDYKIKPIRKWVKENYGKARLWIGISIDEMNRARFSRVRFIENIYPLIDIKYTRFSCISYMESIGVEPPKKSSCYYCPFHNDYFWLMLKNDHPEIFEQACVFDEQIRDKGQFKPHREQFLHRTCVPLRDVTFRHERQYNLEFTCSGGCNT